MNKENVNTAGNTAVFYCPIDVHLFTGYTVHEVFDDDEILETRERWEETLIKHPQKYAAMLNQDVQNYMNGEMRLEYIHNENHTVNRFTHAHCTVVEKNEILWLRTECELDIKLSDEEMKQLQKRIAGSIVENVEIIGQWGLMDLDNGALIIRPQPIDDWSFCTNGYQPDFESLVDENHLMTESEWKDSWFMRLTIQNSRTGKTAFAMYPCDKYEIMESLDTCGIPYGGDNYIHLAQSTNGVKADSIQLTLTGIIEHSEHPPSIKELNYLSNQIQRMDKKERSEFEKLIAGITNATIVEAINVSHSVLSSNVIYDRKSMAERAIFWGEDDPYFKVRLAIDDDYPDGEEGILVECPVTEAEQKRIAEKMGVGSLNSLCLMEVYGTIENIYEWCDNPFVTFDQVNHLAAAMKNHNIGRELGKYKAILELESCFDLSKATKLAGELSHYEFIQEDTLGGVGIRYLNEHPQWDNEEELAEYLGFEDTNYGVIRKIDKEMKHNHELN